MKKTRKLSNLKDELKQKHPELKHMMKKKMDERMGEG